MPGPEDPNTPRPAGTGPSVTARELASLATLRAMRSLVRGWKLVSLTVVTASVIAVFSMWVGGMLTLFPTQGAYTVEILWSGSASSWWFYPEILVVQPWGLLQLPLFPTVAVGLVSAGAAVGAVSGAALARRIWKSERQRRRGGRGSALVTGAAPGIASLATAGACCCSTCASSGGLALVAAASGTSVASLLTTDWYLPLFQLVVVYVLLLGQERALRRARATGVAPIAVDARFVAGSVLRLVLLVAGLTWSLAMFVEWGVQDPWTASAATWYHWLFEHQLLSVVAVTAALFPSEVAGALAGARSALLPGGLRGGLAIAALTWGTWVPPALVGLGLGGFGNEVFGALGLPAAWGAVPPDAPSSAILAFHWAFQHLALSTFALSFALHPEWALRPLRWSVDRATPGSAPVESEEIRSAVRAPGLDATAAASALGAGARSALDPPS